MTKNKEDKNKKEDIKSEKEKNVEEINLDEIDMEDLGLPQGGCHCAAGPMSCHDDEEGVEKDKK
jgi:hypothetical protein